MRGSPGSEGSCGVAFLRRYEPDQVPRVLLSDLGPPIRQQPGRAPSERVRGLDRRRPDLPLAAVVLVITLAGYECAKWWCAARLAAGRSTPWRPLALVPLAIVVVLAVLTARRNRDYSDPVRLWTATLAKAPHNPRAMTNLGAALFDDRRPNDAIALYRKAVRQDSLLRSTLSHFAQVKATNQRPTD